MNSRFNAIDYAQQLEAAGVPQTQAEVHAKMMSLALTNCAASKSDLAALNAQLTARMDTIETHLIAEIAALGESVVRQLAIMRDFRAMREDISAIRADLRYIGWGLHLMVAMQIVMLVKLYSQ